MEESNIFFVTNTFNYGGTYTGEARNKFKERVANKEFFQQVMDYSALMRLKNDPRMHGVSNSNYYTANIKQIHVLDPDFSSVMLNHRKKDPEVEAENARSMDMM